MKIYFIWDMSIPEKKRILIADPSSISIREIFNSESAKHYDILTVDNGPECLEKLHLFKPHLLIIELLLPQMHGIEILKLVKSNPETASIGVIIASSLTMLQNYNAAIGLGACYFLTKPFGHHHFFSLIERFFNGNLTPEPFSNMMPHYDRHVSFHPILSTTSSYLKFWGTRGSNPVSGPKYIQYGGNTCCLEIHHNDTVVIIDAGTGIRELGDVIPVKEGHSIPLIIGHTHWDHITGFPFFAPVYRKDCHMEIFVPVGYEKDTKDLFKDMLSYGYFPVRLEEMFAHLTFKTIRDSDILRFGEIEISCHHANHPGPTLCFKIKSPHRTVGYITDNEVLLGYHGAPGNIAKDHFLLESHLGLLHFLMDCHLIIHEAQYFPDEYHDKVGWGHSSISNVIAFLKHLKCCQEWICTHHDPRHKDEDLHIKAQMHQDVLNECDMHIKFRMAYDGLVIPF